MTDLTPGLLVFAPNSKPGQPPIRRLSYQNKKGDMTAPGAFQLEQLSADLAQRTEPEIEVELELAGGKPVRIRPRGGSWVDPGRSAPPLARTPQPGRAQNGRPGPGRQARTARESGHHHHNPYSFIPAPPRDTDGNKPLGDRPAPHQDRFHAGLHYGRIIVEMTAETPLLVPDATGARELENGHKILPLRTHADGTPDIPPTAVKGMLRAAYEAVTNSRFGIFAEHDRRLGRRMESKDALGMVPARIRDGRVELCLGTNHESILRSDSAPPTACAAWLPRYTAGRPENENRRALTYTEDGSLPQHGDRVRCLIRRYRQHRWNRGRSQHEASFEYWRVIAIARADGGATPVPPSGQRDFPRRDGANWHEPLEEQRTVEGWVSITNQNFSKKHDERVFFTAAAKPPSFALDPAWRAAWDDLIADYRAIHEKDLEKRRGKAAPDSAEARASYAAFRGREPGQTAWSAHLYDDSHAVLRDGTLCHARIDPASGRILGLYPVMISRDLHPVAPSTLLPPSLHPATARNELSPADRVFGWVNGKGAGASRGNLRIGPVEPVADTVVVDRFDPPLPLAILGQPKPHYARFYVADDDQGRAQPTGTDRKNTGYTLGKGLRGRKVYPHHKALPEGYWTASADAPLAHAGRFREYLRAPSDDPKDRRQDDQNRSVDAWVRPGSSFRFAIDVGHLTDEELGALLWLLDLPDEAVHRFGGGKPLGFGSVRLRMVKAELADGAALTDRYRSLSPVAATGSDGRRAIERFKHAVKAAYQGGALPFERAPWIAAFLTAARGLGTDRAPVHYPRAVLPDDRGHPRPRARGENFRWFVENDREGGRSALPDLDTPPAPLPLWPSET